jgi:hypothetical protein
MIAAWMGHQKHWMIDAMQSPTESREVHYAGIEDRRGQTLRETEDEWQRTQTALTDVIRSLNDTQWRSPAPFETRQPLDLAGALEIILVAPPRPAYRHLPVHIPDSAAYIRTLRG